ncbi:VOC family protein [Amycolatopsis acidiphila]|uniref:VOC family protein n=1 Tax=Amycolatopsis acidiphila TaxID=715473 RepID=A0A558AG84_9PSEU|nr:VOC family protein [Amycolatopsis acidiphila]TVT23253.1 VOC family protein [Amycolatopsis acidiphila]UIJ56470.1 VOC family protein [Amycolatopsis acidiphila]GHG67080.1 chaP protein [Amycolatopsis acidiphila]
MPVQLNHTIVEARDRQETASFLADVLGLAEPEPYGPFLVVSTDNGVSLDVVETGGPVHSQHYAFLVGEDEFDRIFGRITERGLEYWADPFGKEPGRVNHNDGGRGVYWADPNGHRLEIITRPYGG